jgi:hypothetical protein
MLPKGVGTLPWRRIPTLAGLALALLSSFVLFGSRVPGPAAEERRRPRTLIFTAIGDTVQLRPFLDIDAGIADIAAAYYGTNDSRFAELRADPRIRTVFRLHGSKFQLLWAFCAQSRDFMASYEWLAAFDDDLPNPTAEVAGMLRDVAAHGESNEFAAVYSPAHAKRGKISYAQMVTQGCACPCSPTNGSCAGLPAEFRKVSFVEMSWPIFRTSFALEFLDVYTPILTGHGADLWFSFLAKEKGLDVYLVDSVAASNPKPQQKGFQSGFEHGEMSEAFPYRRMIFNTLRKEKSSLVRIAGSEAEHTEMQVEMRKPSSCCAKKL